MPQDQWQRAAVICKQHQVLETHLRSRGITPDNTQMAEVARQLDDFLSSIEGITACALIAAAVKPIRLADNGKSDDFYTFYSLDYRGFCEFKKNGSRLISGLETVLAILNDKDNKMKPEEILPTIRARLDTVAAQVLQEVVV